MADVNTRASANGDKVKESHIDIEVIIFDVIRHWWVIVIGCLIVAMISYIFVTERYKPEYYAGATFVVSGRDSTTNTVYANLSNANKLATSFTYVLKSPILRQTVANELGLKNFDGIVDASLIENTNLISIFVIASSPQIAFDEMNGIIEYHHIVSDNIMGNVVMDVLRKPTVPAGPTKLMNRNGTIIKNVLITALLIIALLVIFSVASDSIMTEANLVNRVDCPPLATIRHERKNLSLRARLRGAKASMLITNPTTSFRFAETFRLFRTRLEYIMKRKGYKVLMVSSVLENEGKTTMAANVAIMLALNNKKVLTLELFRNSVWVLKNTCLDYRTLTLIYPLLSLCSNGLKICRCYVMPKPFHSSVTDCRLKRKRNTAVTSENFCKNLNSHSYGNIYECPFRKGVSLLVARFSVPTNPPFLNQVWFPPMSVA